jgi:hypothetical protein
MKALDGPEEVDRYSFIGNIRKLKGMGIVADRIPLVQPSTSLLDGGFCR